AVPVYQRLEGGLVAAGDEARQQLAVRQPAPARRGQDPVNVLESLPQAVRHGIVLTSYQIVGRHRTAHQSFQGILPARPRAAAAGVDSVEENGPDGPIRSTGKKDLPPGVAKPPGRGRFGVRRGSPLWMLFFFSAT